MSGRGPARAEDGYCHKRPSVRATLALLCAVAVSAFMCCAVLAQSNLGFLKNAPMGSFKDDDVKLMMQTAEAVLNSPDPGTTRAWQNAATGNGGEIKKLSSFNTKDGRECHRLQVHNYTKQHVESLSTTNMCRSQGGKWLIDPEAQPAPKATP
jgi:surface antigen